MNELNNIEHKFEDGQDEGLWVGGHPLIINGYGVFGKDATQLLTTITEQVRLGKISELEFLLGWCGSDDEPHFDAVGLRDRIAQLKSTTLLEGEK